MIKKKYAYSKEKKILKKYAFLPPLTATNPLIRKIPIINCFCSFPGKIFDHIFRSYKSIIIYNVSKK